MKAGWLFACLAAGALMLPAAADARRQYGNDRHDWQDRWENRRDARRAGIVAGAVASSVARTAGNERAEQRYAECMQTAGADPQYDYACERRRYEDEMQARRAGRRAGTVVGMTAREIVRD